MFYVGLMMAVIQPKHVAMYLTNNFVINDDIVVFLDWIKITLY